MGEMTTAFTTQRLRVFETTVKPYEDRDTQNVFLAYLISWNTPQPVVYAIVSDNRTSGGSVFPLYCEWLQVAPPYLRGGYGKELFLGIEGHFGAQMAAAASTSEGIAFLTALGRPIDPLAPVFKEMLTPVFNTPAFQARLEEEILRMAQLPAEQRPLDMSVVSEKIEALMEVAPLHLMKYLMTATDVTMSYRVELIERFLNKIAPSTV